jgi:hypothetical protein
VHTEHDLDMEFPCIGEIKCDNIAMNNWVKWL